MNRLKNNNVAIPVISGASLVDANNTQFANNN
jgi:hypothetical protein